MHPKDQENTEHSETIALNALAFLLGDGERLERFMALSGLTAEAIRAGATDTAFLGGVFDYLLADQTLLLIFAEQHGLKPERIATLRRKLPGAALDF